MSVHVFATVYWDWKPSKYSSTWIPILLCIWGYVWLFIAGSWLKSAGAVLYTPSPYWCWIGSNHRATRIMGQFFWMWLTVAISAILSILLYLRLRSRYPPTILVSPSLPASAISRGQRPETTHPNDGKMLWFMASYAVLVIPYSITRWTTFNSIASGHNWVELPFGATVLFTTLFNLSGFIHVLIFLVTRPSLLFSENSTTEASTRVVRFHDNFNVDNAENGYGSPSPPDLHTTIASHHITKLGESSKSPEEPGHDTEEPPEEKDYYKTIKLRPSMFGITLDTQMNGQRSSAGERSLTDASAEGHCPSPDPQLAIPRALHSPAESDNSQSQLLADPTHVRKPPVPASFAPAHPPMAYLRVVPSKRPGTGDSQRSHRLMDRILKRPGTSDSQRSHRLIDKVLKRPGTSDSQRSEFPRDLKRGGSAKGSTKTADGWWEMNEIGSVWLDLYSRPRSPSLRHGTTRPDSMLIASAPSSCPGASGDIPISLPTEWDFQPK
ncbi:hypothetical protein FRB95_005530 [Tulasnella sp. JGI-2019a]|nr:hypothetical protein FRB95_005530 [Tulasnella sp. JGI-2019a]